MRPCLSKLWTFPTTTSSSWVFSTPCNAGDLLMVLCVTMASAVLAASFVVFLVREAESRSKHVQVSLLVNKLQSS